MRSRTLQELNTFSKQQKNKNYHHEKQFARLLRQFKIAYQRQVVITQYIVDFYLPNRNLIIEIDGPNHLTSVEYDQTRHNYLAKWGWIVLHFTWKQLLDTKCIEQILSEPNDKDKAKTSKLRLNRLNKDFHQNKKPINAL